MKITFMGAGSTVFAKNVLGDVMCTPALRECKIALYDIDGERLEESYVMVDSLNRNINESRASVEKYLGVEQRKDALRGADFVVNAIQVGLYEPCTVIDFEVPKKYGLRQTIADSNGIGGIFRALRTIPVLEDFCRDMQEVCPDAYFLNYTNPMAQLAGYLGRYGGVKSVGLCHSVQGCSRGLLRELDIPFTDPIYEKIAGINHMGWLLEIRDNDGTDLYPEIRRRAAAMLENPKPDFKDLVRLEYIRRLGYYCTESSEHNAEYNAFFIKKDHPELIDRYRIPLDEYPRRCVEQIARWKNDREKYVQGNVTHERTKEYASYIMESIVTDQAYKIGGNVINKGHLIENYPENACVEVPCLVNRAGIQPCYVGELPLQLAAMNMNMINVHLLTIEAAVTKKKEYIYQAAMLDPLCASQLTIDEIISLCDDLIEAHTGWLPEYH